ncbi:MAG: hypothetical protein P8I94_05970, partial [Emcibacteraceae bacterium]|nr:hypothetical protein [Emcibacteraceae bacterium]
DWHQPRPQNLIVIALCTCDVLLDYADWLGFEELNSMKEDILVLRNNIIKVDKAHENWLIDRTS